MKCCFILGGGCCFDFLTLVFIVSFLYKQVSFLLSIFIITGCADSNDGKSSNNTENTGDGGNTGGDTPDNPAITDSGFIKFINVAGLSYGETADSKKYIWGKVGELVSENPTEIKSEPVEVPFNITHINEYCVALDNGSLYCNSNNELKNIGKIDGNIKEFKISSYNDPTYYVLTDTALYAWGDNRYGQVGNNSTENVLTPQKIEGIDGKINKLIIEEKFVTVYALTDTGLYAWGYNGNGQVGNNSTENALMPHKVMDEVIEKLVTGNTVYAITSNNDLYAWGGNARGQAGKEPAGNVLQPNKIDGINGTIKEINTGLEGTVYALTDNDVYVWGYNRYGQFGNGVTDMEIHSVPQKISGISGRIEELVAERISIYVRTDTGLYAWGGGSYGQLGNGDSGVNAKERTPQLVNGIDGTMQELIADGRNVYVRTDTCLYAWGDNSVGQVGNNSIAIASTPQKVINETVEKLIVVNNTVFALTGTGLYSWGNNDNGQVGNNSTSIASTPQKVINEAVEKLVVVNNTVFALTDTGLYSWGNNDNGQTGNGNTENVLTPYKILINK